MTFDTQHARLHRSLACAAALALAASAAAADDAAAPADDAQKAWSVTVGGGALHQFTTDLDRAGDVSVERGYGVALFDSRARTLLDWRVFLLPAEPQTRTWFQANGRPVIFLGEPPDMPVRPAGPLH